jgi:hypothetical protein
MTLRSNESIQLFPKLICLTLPEQRERQSAVVQEFVKVGIHNYEFYPGFSSTSVEVTRAYEENRVKRYPDCFRCGTRDCGSIDCNNVLLPTQVAVALGFQAILKMVANSGQPYAAICEDDIIFAGYARSVLTSRNFQDVIQSSGLLTDGPVLVRLGRPSVGEDFFSIDGACDVAIRITDEVVMSNTFFLVNQAFARLAYARLNQINHTADVIIHDFMTTQAHCYTLNVQLVGDRSWGLGDIPSLIHPRANHLAYLRSMYGESSPKFLHEVERISNHVKKAVSREYCFTGSPRCGSHFVSAFLRGNGLDVGHESVGRDGICAWQYAVSSHNYPYVSDRQARSDFFVHPDTWFVYARSPVTAIPSLVVENQWAPLSYAFRRDAIYKNSGVNLDDFTSPEEKAARSYAHWYLLALKRQPKAVLRVEKFLEDCRQNIRSHDFAPVEILASEAGAGKSYLGILHKPDALEQGWMNRLSKETFQVLKHVSDYLGYQI